MVLFIVDVAIVLCGF